jgi:hypothetical protein
MDSTGVTSRGPRGSVFSNLSDHSWLSIWPFAIQVLLKLDFI